MAAAPAQSGRVWAIIEAEDAGLYRSDDGGRTWAPSTAWNRGQYLPHDHALDRAVWMADEERADWGLGKVQR